MKKLRDTETAALAENIRAVRVNSGMSQREFAWSVGVSQQKISEWERGVGLTQLVVAWRLAEALARIRHAAQANERKAAHGAKGRSK